MHAYNDSEYIFEKKGGFCMKEFKNFKAKGGHNGDSTLNVVDVSNLDANGVNGDNNINATEDIQGAINKYSSMDRDELMQQLVTTISTQKANGTYDKERMAYFMSMASSIAPKEQVEKMQKIIDELE